MVGRLCGQGQRGDYFLIQPFPLLTNWRQNYLGHSINAPTGRWQKNKDVHWYSRELEDSEAERLEEIRKVKEAEAEALSVALCVVLTLTGMALS